MHFENRLEEVTAKIKTLFSQETLDLTARETGFVRRITNKINPLSFLILMVVHMAMNSLCSLSRMTDLLAAMEGGVKISAQALSQRINSLFPVRFLRRCYSHLLVENTQNIVNDLNQKGLLKGFNKVFLEDSTTCELNEKLATSFKGCGGSAFKAGYKIHLIWDAISGAIQTLLITASCITDQSMASHILNFVKEGNLVIRDLGYFSVPIFAKIAKLKGFFLSRLKKQVNVYTLDGRKIDDLPKYINKYFPDDAVVELKVLLGKKEKLEVRLIAYRVPSEVVNQRMRKQREVARKQGGTVKKDRKNWCKFTFLITNVSEEVWKPEVLATVYKLRWKIELVFKSWKSLAHIDIIKGEYENRVHCFIIGRLIAILIMTAYFSCCKQYVDGKFSRELSLHKFISWILLDQRFLSIFSGLDFERGLKEKLEESMLDLCKQRRSRSTTNDHIQNSSTFAILYPESTQNEPLEQLA